MVTDDQNGLGSRRTRRSGPGRLPWAAALAGAVAFLPGCAPTPAPKTAPRLFAGWPANRKPDVVLLLTGQQHGYLEPCGCSEPQFGGLPRRYNFLQSLTKERGWPVVAVDLGDVAQRSGPQSLLKYYYSMKAMDRLGYAAVGIGENEMRIPLAQALGEYALNNETPAVVCANLLDADVKFPQQTRKFAVSDCQGKAPKVGVVSVVGPTVAKKVQDPDVRFGPSGKMLREVLDGEAFGKEAPELRVLLYQGTMQEAKACAAHFPEFQAVLCLDAEEEPSGKAEKEGDAVVVAVGHKGRCVGALGAYRTGNADKPFDLFYQMVRLGPEYETPAGKEAGNPVMALMEEYSQEVKRGNYVERYPRQRHPVQLAFPRATYVGSERCADCHQKAHDVWEHSPHASAYDKLVKARNPSLRQFDGECVTCHVTGFKYQGGFASEARTPHLKDNGCENCHGPGSLHADDKALRHDKQLLALMNPYKAPANETAEEKERRFDRIDRTCMECHDIDNDVNWTKVPFKEKWEKIMHPEGKGLAANPPADGQ